MHNRIASSVTAPVFLHGISNYSDLQSAFTLNPGELHIYCGGLRPLRETPAARAHRLMINIATPDMLNNPPMFMPYADGTIPNQMPSAPVEKSCE